MREILSRLSLEHRSVDEKLKTIKILKSSSFSTLEVTGDSTKE